METEINAWEYKENTGVYAEFLNRLIVWWLLNKENHDQWLTLLKIWNLPCISHIRGKRNSL